MKTRFLLLTVSFVLAACNPSPTENSVTPAVNSSQNPTRLSDQSIPSHSTLLAEAQPATVVSTGDGDTLRVSQAGQTLTLRLGCIDSPETDQPGGTAAASRLRELLPRDQAVQIVPIETDRYGRTVAVVFANGQSVNLQMVREGQAVVYQQYLDGCPNSRDDLLAAEAAARSERLGFWAQENPIMPWDWRRGERSSAGSVSAPAFPTEPSGSSVQMPACVNSDCDCKDFQTQAEAQRVFESFAGDPFRLDGDGDGRVCEALP